MLLCRAHAPQPPPSMRWRTLYLCRPLTRMQRRLDDPDSASAANAAPTAAAEVPACVAWLVARRTATPARSGT